jgi:hypothetical protein
MESTTDSPEQIAEGLGVESDEPAVETADGEADPAAIEEPPVEGDEPAEETDEPPAGEVTRHPEKVVAAKAKPTVKGKKLAPRNVNGAIAAARREAEAKTKVAETERDAALARVKELTTGIERPAPRAQIPPSAKPIVAEDVPDTHPRIAALLTKMTALGAKPKQGDFEDFEEFEEKRDKWIEDRATLRGRVESVREDVARQATLESDEANRAAADTASSFKLTEDHAREQHDDYDEQIAAAAKAGLRVSDDIATAILESPHGGELRYYLCAHPSEVDRIMALRPHRQIAELGIIESRIAASLPEQKPKARPTARVTKAPDPQQNLIGDLGGGGTRFKTREEEMNHPGTTLARYNVLRNQMDVETGRRTH